MNRENFNKHVEYVFERSRKVLVKKGIEYSNDRDVFHNFNEAIGASLHQENTSVAWEYMIKHFQSIKDLIVHQEQTCLLPNYSSEYLDEKFCDLQNYFILIEGMLREKLKNTNQPSNI